MHLTPSRSDPAIKDYRLAKFLIAEGKPVPTDVTARLIAAGYNPSDMMESE